MLRILIADDHPVVRKGLAQVLAEAEEGVVIEEARNGQEALSKALTEDWDVVLLDITMPGRGGIEVLQQLRKDKPKLPVLVLSIHSEEEYAIRALRAGAFGYLTKAGATEELVRAVRKAVTGKKYVSPEVAEKLASFLGPGAEGQPHDALSDREFEIVKRIACGQTAGQIADELCLSVKSVSTYRIRALKKMGLKNTAELIHYAIKNRLLD